jgi:GAF domain-containing protein/HAMP domain-containing protein
MKNKIDGEQSPSSLLALSPQFRNAIIIVQIGMVIAFAATIFSTYLIYRYGDWQFIALVSISGCMALVSLVSVIAIQKGKGWGIWLFLLVGQIALTFSSLLVAGFGLITFSGILILTLLTAYQTLPSRQARWAVYTGLIFGLLSGIVDWLQPTFQTSPSPELNIAIPVILVATIVAFSAMFFRGMRQFNLRTQLVAVFIAVSSLSIAAVTLFSNIYIQRRLSFDANIRLYNSAAQTGRLLDEFIAEKLTSIETQSQIPDITDLLSQDPGIRDGSSQQVRANHTLATIQKAESESVSSYALLDSNGIIIADSSIAHLGQDESGNDYFEQAIQTRSTYVSPVKYSLEQKQGVLYFSTPIISESGAILGVMRASYLSSSLDKIILKSTGLAGSGSYAFLVDEYGVWISHPVEPDLTFKTIGKLSDETYSQLKMEGRIPDLPLEQLSVNLPDLTSALRESETRPFLTMELEENPAQGRPSIEQGAIVGLRRQPWKLVYAIDQATFLTPIEAQTRSTTLLGIVIASLAALGGYLMALFIAAPITQLTKIAREAASGNLTAQAPVESDNELGSLGKAFNTMTNQYRLMLEGLEQRITDRTHDLERRALQMRASAEVVNAVTSIRSIDVLLPKITQLISERFGFYHVGIFLIDSLNEFAVLRATNSEGGARMLERGHKLKVGEVGIVGFVTGNKQSRIAMDVGQDSVFFNNPDLPDTRSEMALPLIIGERVLGALDVQSVDPGAFTQEDIDTLQLLADQVAIAIDNARLFSENQAALEATQRAYGRLSREAWAKMLHDRPELGVIADRFDMTYSPAESWSSEMLEASQSGETLRIRDETVAIPIKDRDHVLGILRLSKPEGHPWSKDDVALAENLAQQLYLALENARLYRETQRRAERERLAGDITAKMRQTNDPDRILQTTIQELRKALNIERGNVPDSQVVMHAQVNPENGGSSRSGEEG